MDLAVPVPASPARLPGRLWQYQRERFPLAAHGTLVAVFAFGVTAYGAQGMPAPGRVLAAAVVVLLAFLQLRVADEHKDAAVDARYRPHRAVPRGLVTLPELRRVALAAAAVQLGLAAWLGPRALLALGGVWAFGALMTAEFFAPAWLRARPGAYLATHLGVLPLLDLFSMVVGARAAPLPDGYGALLAMAYAGGGVFEVGRKLRAPGDERAGVETYSAAWGLPRALAVWMGFVAASALTLGTAAGPGLRAALALGVAALGAGAWAVARRPTAARVARVERASGLWLVALYAALGLTTIA
jgi:hypothetical protein